MKFVRSILAAVLAAIVVVAGCDKVSDPLAPDAPLVPQSVLVPGTDGKTYTLVEGQLRTSKKSVSAWIGPLGGTLILPGESNDALPAFHALIVPPLAVLQSTQFTMSIASDKYVQVDLRAQVKTLFGMKDVGHQGFNLPVVLWLSYANATNLVNVDLNGLVILHDPGNGKPYEPVRSLVQIGLHKYVIGTLFHFSKYAMAVD